MVATTCVLPLLPPCCRPGASRKFPPQKDFPISLDGWSTGRAGSWTDGQGFAAKQRMAGASWTAKRPAPRRPSAISLTFLDRRPGVRSLVAAAYFMLPGRTQGAQSLAYHFLACILGAWHDLQGGRRLTGKIGVLKEAP